MPREDNCKVLGRTRALVREPSDIIPKRAACRTRLVVELIVLFTHRTEQEKKKKTDFPAMRSVLLRRRKVMVPRLARVAPLEESFTHTYDFDILTPYSPSTHARAAKSRHMRRAPTGTYPNRCTYTYNGKETYSSRRRVRPLHDHHAYIVIAYKPSA